MEKEILDGIKLQGAKGELRKIILSTLWEVRTNIDRARDEPEFVNFTKIIQKIEKYISDVKELNSELIKITKQGEKIGR